MSRIGRIVIERLEDRDAPAVFGVPWPDPQHLTLSFMPDGTPLPHGQQSELFRLLDAQAPRPTWQTEILRAFQTWLQHANIDLGLVADSGLPGGETGLSQGDLRFGDIRIGSYPLGGDAIAVSLPFDVTAGTWAGDLKLNTTAGFGIGSDFDLYSIVLHEAGHAFGIGHSDDPASPLFDTYQGIRQGLSADDIAALLDLYGPRWDDAFDARARNDQLGNATRLNESVSPSAPGTLAVTADLTTAQDVDWYTFRTNADRFTVTLQTAGRSLLVGRLSIYDADGQLVRTVAAGSPLDGNLTVTVDVPAPGKAGSHAQRVARYYVRVDSIDADFAVGGYGLQIEEPSGPGGPPPPRFTDADSHGNDDPSQAVSLRPRAYRGDSRFAYAHQASLSYVGDVDFYRFLTPKSGASVITLSVWGSDQNGLRPVIRLYDNQGNPLPAQVLVSDSGVYTLQFSGATGNTNYLLSVEAGRLGEATGNYFLGIDFGERASGLQTLLADRVLDPARPLGTGTLHVEQSQLLHLVLTADKLDADAGGAIRLTITDAQGNLVLDELVPAGEVQSCHVLLEPGDYQVEYRGVGLESGALSFTFQALGISDPVGPHPLDTTQTPGTPGLPRPFWWEEGFYGVIHQPPTSGGTGGSGGSSGGGLEPTPPGSAGGGVPLPGSGTATASVLPVIDSPSGRQFVFTVITGRTPASALPAANAAGDSGSSPVGGRSPVGGGFVWLALPDLGPASAASSGHLPAQAVRPAPATWHLLPRRGLPLTGAIYRVSQAPGLDWPEAVSPQPPGRDRVSHASPDTRWTGPAFLPPAMSDFARPDAFTPVVLLPQQPDHDQPQPAATDSLTVASPAIPLLLVIVFWSVWAGLHPAERQAAWPDESALL